MGHVSKHTKLCSVVMIVGDIVERAHDCVAFSHVPNP